MKVFDHLVGCGLESVTYHKQGHEWIFSFVGKIALQVSAPWRITVGSTIKLGFEDHGQQFGFPIPIDIQERLNELAIGREVDSVEATEQGDLAVRFCGDRSLEIFNSSAGFEGWILNGPGNRYVVAQGGGNVVESSR